VDRNNDVLAKYDFKVYNINRARGAFLLDTDSGLKILKKVDNNKNRILFEHKIKEHLYALGNEMVDVFLYNKDGDIVTCDNQQNNFVVKNWFVGEACEITDLHQIKIAVRNLADLHNDLYNIDFSLDESKYITVENLDFLFDKRNKELRRVRSYIRNKKQKNKFEIIYYKYFDEFYNQAVKAEQLLKASSYRDLMDKSIIEKRICHGNYTYHNVLLDKRHNNNINNEVSREDYMLSASNINNIKLSDVVTVNFDKSHMGLQISDLYYFIRKVMEKNNWDVLYGSQLIEAYDSVRAIKKEELNILYIMLLYPEKFWKITNFYYNSKKSWISERNIQKLETVCGQNPNKETFLNKLEKIL